MSESKKRKRDDRVSEAADAIHDAIATAGLSLFASVGSGAEEVFVYVHRRNASKAVAEVVKNVRTKCNVVIKYIGRIKPAKGTVTDG